MIDIVDALTALRPNAEWDMPDGNYASLNWLDTNQTKPSEADVNAKITELQNAEPLKLLRKERDQKLAETDFYALSDVTMSAAMTTYRQALRDITETYSSLDTVVWPTKP